MKQPTTIWNSKKNHHAPLVHRVTLYQHMYSSAMCTLTKRKQRCCHFITFYRSINTPFSPSYTRQAMGISVETFEMTLRPCKMKIQITQETHIMTSNNSYESLQIIIDAWYLATLIWKPDLIKVYLLIHLNNMIHSKLTYLH